ncbi:MAG: efflux RND transporter periplasmic adaptor subunit [Muribaculaceae bacterium]
MNSIKQILSMACASLLLVSCSGKEETATKQVDEKPLVKIQKVYEQEVPQTAEYTATVEGFKTNNISTSTPNRIKRILVDVGSPVRAGQALVILDDVNIEQQKIRLANQKVNLDRAKELLNIGGGTQQTVDQLQAEYDAAMRAYNNAKENTVLTSPMSGVVTVKNNDPGDYTSGAPILVIEQMQPVKVVVSVNESDFPRIKKGQKVDVKLDVYGDEVFTGTVYLIHPSIDPTTRTFQVEVTLPNGDNRVRSGMFARVIFDFGAKKNVVVPDMAIVKQTGSGNRYVYVYNDGKVSFNKVELGQRLGNSYELISGVPSGSDVVISGQSRLNDGMEVGIANSNAKATQATDSVK